MGTALNEKPLTEKDAKVMAQFKDFITVFEDADRLREGFTRIYVRYTKMLLDSRNDNAQMNVGSDTDLQLSYLSELIEILSGGYEY